MGAVVQFDLVSQLVAAPSKSVLEVILTRALHLSLVYIPFATRTALVSSTTVSQPPSQPNSLSIPNPSIDVPESLVTLLTSTLSLSDAASSRRLWTQLALLMAASLQIALTSSTVSQKELSDPIRKFLVLHMEREKKLDQDQEALAVLASSIAARVVVKFVSSAPSLISGGSSGQPGGLRGALVSAVPRTVDARVQTLANGSGAIIEFLVSEIQGTYDNPSFACLQHQQHQQLQQQQMPRKRVISASLDPSQVSYLVDGLGKIRSMLSALSDA
eukprot:ANDGO_02460.mRNA.1 hypothetical protein